MNAQRHISIQTGILAAAAALAMLAFGPYASANAVRINFGGAMGSGYADLTIGGTDPRDIVDGSDPKTITGASGMFNGVVIRGLRSVDPTSPPAGETKIPHSYSLFSIPKDKGGGDHLGVSYDNLFYPTGSPLICYVPDADGKGNPGFVYPYSGGFLDLMGVMFSLENGNFVDLWSFGFTPGGLVYGMKIITPDGDGYSVLPGSPFAHVSVPEPDLLWLLGAGVLGLFAWRRSSELRKRR